MRRPGNGQGFAHSAERKIQVDRVAAENAAARERRDVVVALLFARKIISTLNKRFEWPGWLMACPAIAVTFQGYDDVTFEGYRRVTHEVRQARRAAVR